MAMLNPLQRGDDSQTVDRSETGSETNNTASSHLTRRDAVKQGIGSVAGATVLSSLASDDAAAKKPFDTEGGGDGGDNGLHTEGPAHTTGKGAFSDDAAEVELALSGPKRTQGNTIPVGVMFACSLPQPDTSWHEIRDLTVEFRLADNPTEGDIWTYRAHEPSSGKNEEIAAVLQILGEAAWTIAQVPVNPFAFFPTDDTVDSDLSNERKNLSITWPKFKGGKSGGVRLASRLSKNGPPREGQYTFEAEMTGIVYHVNPYSGGGKTDEFSVTESIDVKHTN